MDWAAKTYLGFQYNASQLVRFIESGFVFTILLTSGEVIHFEPEDSADFYCWLVGNGIKDIKQPPTSS